MPLVLRSEESSVAGVSADCVNSIRVGRIDRDALDAHPVTKAAWQPVKHLLPGIGRLIPAVCSADIRASVNDILSGRVADNPVYKSSAVNNDGFVSVRDGRRLRSGRETG